MVGGIVMKTKVRVTCNSYYYDVHEGDIGYVDGYLRGYDNINCAVVVIGKRFTLVPLHMIELYEDKNN